jgi:hypothetical protein
MPTHNAAEGPLPNIQTRVCSGEGGCGLSKPRAAFGWGRNTSLCLDCRRKAAAENMRARRSADPTMVRRMNLWRLYRMRPEQYDRMRADQGFRCAACGVHESDIDVSSGGGRPRADGSSKTPAFPLHVDHCHATGVVRGLLCSACNRIIGLAAERPDVFLGCAAYLRKNST